MPQRPAFIQLEANEDAASVRDRLSFVRGQRVLLVWPEVGTALTRKLDLVLVQREAMRLAIRLALVTHDAEVTRHAQELNISTFETIGASERSKWKRGRSKAFISRSQRPTDSIDAEDLMPVASRIRQDDETPAQRRRQRVLRRLLVIVAVIAVAGVGYVVVPSAVVTIVPVILSESVTIAISADPTADSAFVDVENGIIPALTLRVQIEERASVPTSGQRTLTDTRAQGSVVFVNKTNGAVTIPAGAFISTSAGTPILFRTLEDALIPAGIGLQTEVRIEAVDEALGTVGNVESGLINTVLGPLADSVDVRNIAPTGGGENRVIRTVSDADHARLIATLRQQMQNRAFTEMLPRLSDSQFIIPETIFIAEERPDWQIFDAPIGANADSVSLTMRAVVQATAVDEQLAQQVAFARFAQQIPRGYTIRPDSLTYERGDVSSTDPQGRVASRCKPAGKPIAHLMPSRCKQRSLDAR